MHTPSLHTHAHVLPHLVHVQCKYSKPRYRCAVDSVDGTVTRSYMRIHDRRKIIGVQCKGLCCLRGISRSRCPGRGGLAHTRYVHQQIEPALLNNVPTRSIEAFREFQGMAWTATIVLLIGGVEHHFPFRLNLLTLCITFSWSLPVRFRVSSANTAEQNVQGKGTGVRLRAAPGSKKSTKKSDRTDFFQKDRSEWWGRRADAVEKVC